MADKQELSFTEQEAIGKTIIHLIRQSPFFKDISVKMQDVDINGLGVFTQQGSVYLNRYMDGSYKGQYNFFIGYKIKLSSDTMKSDEQDKLSALSKWLEGEIVEYHGKSFQLTEYPALSDKRKILEILRTSDVYVDGIEKDGTTYYRSNLQLKYLKKV